MSNAAFSGVTCSSSTLATALGGARSFARTYKNIASHPAATPQQAAEKLRLRKAGFLEALRIYAGAEKFNTSN